MFRLSRSEHLSRRPALIALEKGKPGITTTEIDRIAEQLELDAASLLLGRAEPRPTMSIFLKHQGVQDFNHEAEGILDRALDAGRSLRFLNRSLGCAPVLRLWGTSTQAAPGKDPAREGYERANVLRRHLKLPKEPMPDLGESLKSASRSSWLWKSSRRRR